MQVSQQITQLLVAPDIYQVLDCSHETKRRLLLGRKVMTNLAAAAAAAASLQLCPTLCDPIDGSPTGSPVPGILQGKNTGVGCHFLLQCMKAKSESEVAQTAY